MDWKKTSLDSGVRPEQWYNSPSTENFCFSTRTSRVLPAKAACFFARIGTRSSSLIRRQRRSFVLRGTSSLSLRSE